MKRNLSVFALAAILMTGSFSPSLRASESDRKTILTVSQPIAVQGTMLPAGKYVLKLYDSPSSRDIVLVFNGEETQLITTIRGIPTDRLLPPDKSEFSFYDPQTGQPAALHTWFYPGNENGLEFLRPQSNTAGSGALAKSTPMPPPKHRAVGKSGAVAAN
jgi:hypothetical protein